MILRPKAGQRVTLVYAKAKRKLAPYHGWSGVVRVAGRGPGPLNAAVDLDGGPTVVVGRGNLVTESVGRIPGLF